MPLNFLIFLLPLLSLSVQGKTVSYTWTVSYISGAPDGVPVNHILAINGKFPGPVINAVAGDTVQVKVINRIQDGQNVSLHWHGIHQRGTPFEDGPMQVTQCPIKAGSHQTYTFKVPIAGTYWYHSHVNSQYTEGLWGVIIIRNRQEPYGHLYDSEILITLNDWYHTSAHENEDWLLSPESNGVSPYPFSVLINGNGSYPCSYAKLQGKPCSEAQYQPVFRVIGGKSYRLRVVNTSGLTAFNFTVDSHKLITIEVDGVDTITSRGGTGDATLIGAGQRYSFLLKTDEDYPLNRQFLIRASVRTDLLLLRDGNINKYPEALKEGQEVTGAIMYSTWSPTDENDMIEPSWETVRRRSVVNWDSLKFVEDTAMIPYDRAPAPQKYDRNVVLNIIFVAGSDRIRRGTFNGRPSFLPEGKPQLAYYMAGEEIPRKGMPFVVHWGEITQIVVNNPGGFPHPIHMHGHHFWVMGVGKPGDGHYSRRHHRLNYNGVRRDTLMVPGESWIVIWFEADNPGIWSLHCHIDWHMLTGMVMAFVEAPENRTSLYVPREARRVCSEHGIRF